MYGFRLTCGRELVSLGIRHVAGRDRFVLAMSLLLGVPYHLPMERDGEDASL
jgi:hypothetical protein